MNEKYRKYVKSAIVFEGDEFEKILSPLSIKAEYTFEGFRYTDGMNDEVEQDYITNYLSECLGVTVLKIFTDSEWDEYWDIWIEFIE